MRAFIASQNFRPLLFGEMGNNAYINQHSLKGTWVAKTAGNQFYHSAINLKMFWNYSRPWQENKIFFQSRLRVKSHIHNIQFLGKKYGFQFPLSQQFFRNWLTYWTDLLKSWTSWPESASELYRPSDLLLPAKLVATFRVIGVSHSQRCGSPTAVISVSRPEPLLFLSSRSSVVLTRLSGPRSRPIIQKIR
jgi:hypothetical protein